MKKEVRHVKSILDEILTKWDKERVQRRDIVLAAWRSALEEESRKHAHPISLKRGILMIAVENPAWLYQLTLGKRETLKKFNTAYTGRKKAKEIRFRVGIISE